MIFDFFLVQFPKPQRWNFKFLIFKNKNIDVKNNNGKILRFILNNFKKESIYNYNGEKKAKDNIGEHIKRKYGKILLAHYPFISYSFFIHYNYYAIKNAN